MEERAGMSSLPSFFPWIGLVAVAVVATAMAVASGGTAIFEEESKEGGI